MNLLSSLRRLFINTDIVLVRDPLERTDKDLGFPVESAKNLRIILDAIEEEQTNKPGPQI